MSLINDALKKAQRERSGAAPQPLPAASATPAHAPGNRAPARPATNLWPIAIAAVALVGGGAAVWFLKPAAPAPATVAATVQPVAPLVPATPAQVAPATTPAEPALPLLHINIPASPAATPPPVAVAQPLPPPPVAAPAPATPPATAAPAAPFQVTLQLEDPRILAFLDNARINGIRIAADDAKLSMNNKIFRTGDVVDRELGLKLMTIRPGELVFEDKRGIQYRKLL